MLDQRLFHEADRQLTICNACRYCEGLCPVFPALERRNSFLEGDILYLANLCHDCRACMPACPYTDPHEFAIDIPTVMAEVRRETYISYAFPRIFGEAFMRRSRTVGIFTLVSVVLAIVLVWAGRPGDLFTAEIGPGAFYRVVPWLFMLIPATVATAYAFLVMRLGLLRFWRDTDGPLRSRFNPLALLSATGDVFGLRQMRGGGPGCSYPEEAPSHIPGADAPARLLRLPRHVRFDDRCRGLPGDPRDPAPVSTCSACPWSSARSAAWLRSSAVSACSR